MGASRPAFDPAMMGALVLYAYARGNRSSRAIERACVKDVAYRVIAAQRKPDHATIARFVERHQHALAELFGAVLGVCAKAGVVSLSIVAVDGSKVAANAGRTTAGIRCASTLAACVRSRAAVHAGHTVFR